MVVKAAVAGCSTEFAHSALIIGADEDLRRVLAPQVRRCVAAGEEVLLVVGDRTRATLGAEIADLSEHVRWLDPTVLYQRLGFAYEAFRRLLADQHAAGRRVHLVVEPGLTGEVSGDLPVDRAGAYLAYEAVGTETYAPYGSPVTCVWDSRHHPPTVIGGVLATHTHQLTATGLQPSRHYLPPAQYLAGQQAELTAPPARTDADVVLEDVTELAALRALLHTWGAERGFGRQAADDIVVAVVEVATNGLRYTGGPVRVRAWHRGDTLIVQCDDSGGSPVPASAGYHRPGPAEASRRGATPGGRGLWLARQLADVVAVESQPGRTHVRLYFPHAVTHRGLG